MNRRQGSLSADYFDALYAAERDPWRFESSEYEATKYEATLAALPRSHYHHALEVGCSIGVLTRQLASRCNRVLAIDASAAPLATAERRCANTQNIVFKQMNAPRDWPDDVFDLILLSEVLYYSDEKDIAATAVATQRTLMEEGTVALVHWTGLTDYPLLGDDAADLFLSHAESFTHVLSQARTDRYRIDILERP